MASISRSFAGVLAIVAFLVTLCRGVSQSHAASDAIANALMAMAVFAVIGKLIGWIAERSLEESVKQTVLSKDR